jgi:hypothetical protein
MRPGGMRRGATLREGGASNGNRLDLALEVGDGGGDGALVV